MRTITLAALNGGSAQRPLTEGRLAWAMCGDRDPLSVPLAGHTDWVTGVAAVPLPDGRVLLATTSADETVRLWDPVTATPVGDPLTGHTSTVTAVAAVPLPDGRVLLATTGGDDRTVRLWDPVTGETRRRWFLGRPALCVASAGGRIFVGTSDMLIALDPFVEDDGRETNEPAGGTDDD
ncbi:MAG: hypothetical protein WAL50_01990 [Kineosporiaceae bacterium]